MLSTCFKDIVGLTRDVCDCPEFQGLPVGFDVSESGYYIADGLSLTEQLYQDCEKGGYVDKLVRSRERAMIEFQKDIAMAMTKNGYSTIGGFFGDFGKDSWNAGVAVNLFNYLTISPIAVNGLMLHLKKVKIFWSIAENITLTIYHGDDFNLGTKVYEEVVTTLSGQATEVLFSNLTTFDLSETSTRIRFVISNHTGAPLNIKRTCCGGRRQLFDDYIQLSGGNALNVAQMLQGYGDDYLQGMLLNGEIKCDGFSSLCNQNAQSNDTKRIIANAINLKAKMILIDEIVGASNINFFTLISKESMYHLRSRFKKEYEEQIDWLPYQLYRQNQSCFICNSRTMTSSGIYH